MDGARPWRWGCLPCLVGVDAAVVGRLFGSEALQTAGAAAAVGAFLPGMLTAWTVPPGK
jgi:hypothetical protein